MNAYRLARKLAPLAAVGLLLLAACERRALTEGVMKTQAADPTDEQKRRVAGFVTHRKIGRAAADQSPPKCSGAAAVFDFGEPPLWRSWGLSPENSRSVPTALAGINRANVGRLNLKWAFGFPNAMRARSHPLYAGGALYVGSQDGTVYALERKTGCVRWTFPAGAEVRTAIIVSDWAAGDETARPLAYFGDVVGNVYAVDAITGALVWKDRADRHPSTTITGAPTLHDRRLYVPVSSLEVIAAANPDYPCCTFRGSVVAYEAKSGARIWQTYTVETPTMRSKNSKGTAQLGPSGAPIWNSPAIDARRQQLYIGTGENYSSPATSTSDSILAIDLAVGQIKWAYQGTAGDAWNTGCLREDKINCPRENGPDFDFGAAAVLAHGSDGKDYVLAGQKSGMVHALDPDTGKRIWQTKVGRGGIAGGVHFGISVVGDTVFVPINDHPDGRSYTEPAHPGLYALDIRTGKYLWKAPNEDVCKGRPLCSAGLGGAITATPELVFAGANDGIFRVYDANNGKVVWSYDSARTFDTVSGSKAKGGAFGGAAAALPYRGTLVMNSGYGFGGRIPGTERHIPGNVLLMFEVE